MNYLFGVDVGGTTIKLGLLDENCKLLKKIEIPTRTENNGAYILKDVNDNIEKIIKEENICHDDVKGIGFGIPGPVVNGVVSTCVNIGWRNVDVINEFKKLTKLNVVIKAANDANLAALGEMHNIKGNHLNAIMITIGTGVGGGIVINGKPLEGVHGAGGEIGHMHIDENHQFKCNCGLTGCLETVASGPGVIRLAKAYLKHYEKSSLFGKEFNCEDVFEAAKSGDELAGLVIDEMAFNIARAFSLLAVTVDPEVFIIGGGVSKAGPYLLDKIKKEYQYLAFGPVRDIEFAVSSLGNDAGMVGAALLTQMK